MNLDELRFERCLDLAAMAQLLPQALGSGGRAQGLQISDVQRSASRRRHPHPLTLRYAFDLQDSATGMLRPQRWYGRVYRDAAAAATAAPLHLAELGLALWPWPADPGLPQLQRLLQPQWVQPFAGRPARSVQLLRHRPEQRVLLRHDFGDAAAPLVVKAFASVATAAAVHRRFQWLWQQQADEAAPLVAQPLALVPQDAAVLLASAPGAPLPLAGDAALPLPARLAAALARLHAAPPALAGDALHDPAHWLREAQRRARKIGRALPALAQRAQALAQRLDSAAQALPAAAPVLIHGDCHPGQWWAHQQRVVLFDLDELALGHPMEDLASLCSKLADAGAAPAFATAVLTAYAQQAPQHYCPRTLQWHLALAQLLQASRAYVFQRPGWPQQLQQRLQRAEDLL